jgi:hypothetical protein
VRVIQAFQAIQIEHKKCERVARESRFGKHLRQLNFKRTEVTQARRIIRPRQVTQTHRIAGNFRRYQTNREEKQDLYHVCFTVAQREQVRVGKVIKQHGDERNKNSARPLEAHGGVDDRRRDLELTAAVKQMGNNVSGVQEDVSNLDGLDLLRTNQTGEGPAVNGSKQMVEQRRVELHRRKSRVSRSFPFLTIAYTPECSYFWSHIGHLGLQQ